MGAAVVGVLVLAGLLGGCAKRRPTYEFEPRVTETWTGSTATGAPTSTETRTESMTSTTMARPSGGWEGRKAW